MGNLSSREKFGLLAIIGLFVIFAVILAVTADPPSTPGRGFENNVIIEQRMRNLQNQ